MPHFCLSYPRNMSNSKAHCTLGDLRSANPSTQALLARTPALPGQTCGHGVVLGAPTLLCFVTRFPALCRSHQHDPPPPPFLCHSTSGITAPLSAVSNSGPSVPFEASSGTQVTVKFRTSVGADISLDCRTTGMGNFENALMHDGTRHRVLVELPLCPPCACLLYASIILVCTLMATHARPTLAYACGHDHRRAHWSHSGPAENGGQH